MIDVDEQRRLPEFGLEVDDGRGGRVVATAVRPAELPKWIAVTALRVRTRAGRRRPRTARIWQVTHVPTGFRLDPWNYPRADAILAAYVYADELPFLSRIHDLLDLTEEERAVIGNVTWRVGDLLRRKPELFGPWARPSRVLVGRYAELLKAGLMSQQELFSLPQHIQVAIDAWLEQGSLDW